MNSIDLTVVIFLAFFALRGFLRGIVREFLSLLKIIAIVLFIIRYETAFQAFLSKTFGEFNYWSSLLIGIILILVTFSIISTLLDYFVNTWDLKLIDRSLGFLIGIAFGILFCYLILSLSIWIADWLSWSTLRTSISSLINQSKILKLIMSLLNSLVGIGLSSPSL